MRRVRAEQRRTLKEHEDRTGIPARIYREAIHSGRLRGAVRPGKRTIYVSDAEVENFIRRQVVPATPAVEQIAAAMAAEIVGKMR